MLLNTKQYEYTKYDNNKTSLAPRCRHNVSPRIIAERWMGRRTWGEVNDVKGGSQMRRVRGINPIFPFY